MRTLIRFLMTAAVLVLIATLAAVLYIRQTGLRGQPQPGALETRVARTFRALAVPADVKARRLPEEAQTYDAFWAGMEHYARYCAVCHANDGSGQGTPLGSGLFPKPPDLRAAATQQLTDGELFYIIDNGVRFTGMPAFGTGESTPEGDRQLWQLVEFVRRLPRITPDELATMEGMNVL
jgi:mono/diheme cytochrome c family protein